MVCLVGRVTETCVSHPRHVDLSYARLRFCALFGSLRSVRDSKSKCCLVLVRSSVARQMTRREEPGLGDSPLPARAASPAHRGTGWHMRRRERAGGSWREGGREGASTGGSEAVGH
jgi:hypothetical protein